MIHFLGTYGTILAIYALVDVIGILGLNLQYGFAGVPNFAFIVYVAVGAYSYALLTLGSPARYTGVQAFFAGTSLPFPLPFVISTVVGFGAGALTGLLLLRRLKAEFRYLIFLAIAFVAAGVVTSLPWILNGSSGLSIIPAPLASTLNLSPFGATYGSMYVALAALFAGASFWLMQRMTRSPWGRLLRAGRDRDFACAALGKRPDLNRYMAFVVGCGFAALSGAVLVGYASAWSPGSWTAPETLVFFAALIVGGAGNNWGALIGVVLVQVGIQQSALFLPAFASPETVAAAQWILICIVMILFIWFRPQGIWPPRLKRYAEPPAEGSRAEAATGGTVRTAQRPAADGSYARADLAAGGILCVGSLSKRFGGVLAVDNVSVDFEAGSITGVMGPNGAGKSTLVAMLAGELAPTSGRVRYLGADVTGRSPASLAQSGIIRTFQLSSEFPTMSVIENLLVGSQGHPGERLVAVLAGKRYWADAEKAALQRAWSLLGEFEMLRMANEAASTLSGGQRRLVEIMRALMAEPTVLLLDEPLAGIARGVREVIISAFERLRDGGVTLVIVEHELDVLHQLADRVIVMARGQKIADGTMAEVVSLPTVRQAYLAG